jgi:RloB-like protein
MNFRPANKQQRSEDYFRKSLPAITPLPEEASEPQAKSFLIVCEGLNTEKHYFKGFDIRPEVITIVGGAGVRKSVVKRAKREAEKEKNKGKEVWCVFDFDVNGANKKQKQEFNEAVELADREGFKAAYSNDAFELWLVLHYQTCSSALHRTGYYAILEKIWKLPSSYETMGKTEGFTSGIYKRMQDDINADESLATRRAKRLEKSHAHRRYADHCPCTTVYKLVHELNLQSSL